MDDGHCSGILFVRVGVRFGTSAKLCVILRVSHFGSGSPETYLFPVPYAANFRDVVKVKSNTVIPWVRIGRDSSYTAVSQCSRANVNVGESRKAYGLGPGSRFNKWPWCAASAIAKTCLGNKKAVPLGGTASMVAVCCEQF